MCRVAPSDSARASSTISRREFLGSAAAGLAVSALGVPMARAQESRPPNFVVIFTDDQGYNDIGCFGSLLIKTPHLDRMAAEGMKLTDFYVSAPVCTPSRASLMTGCYAQRLSLADVPRVDDKGRKPNLVLRSNSEWGLHADEVTIAEVLKERGYATACVGKWHLGHLPPFLPTRQGFDSYFGIAYSNDMKPTPLMRDEEVIEEPAVQETLTERYTEEALTFIRANRDRPFFLYLPHSMPHTPLHVSERFRGKSAGGLYGDVIECIDWGVGEILNTLAEQGIDDQTLVLFTSDNGPWLVRGEHGGSAMPLRAGKGTTYEGGMRVPCIVRWPGHVPAGTVCSEVATTMDVLPSFARLAGTSPPAGRIIDGKDIWPLLSGQPGAKSPHEAFFYFFANELHAVRSGPWKLKFKTTLHNEDIYRPYPQRDAVIPESLYNLAVDPGEQKNVMRDHRDVAERLRALADKAREDLGDSLTGVQGRNVRPIGSLE
jgi:arylsulfatase A